MWVSFEQVRYKSRQSGTCTSCGKKRTRTHDVCHTVNPFNKDATTGLPKTRQQVSADAQLELRWLLSRPLICRGCEDALSYDERVARGEQEKKAKKKWMAQQARQSKSADQGQKEEVTPCR